MMLWKYNIIRIPVMKSVPISEIVNSPGMSLAPEDYLKPEIVYAECGFETEEDAEYYAKDALASIKNKDSDPEKNRYEIKVFQVWQELYYGSPTQVIFHDPELQESHAGIAFEKTVICAECGSTFELEEVQILKELEWIDVEDAIKGDQSASINDYEDPSGC